VPETPANAGVSAVLEAHSGAAKTSIRHQFPDGSGGIWARGRIVRMAHTTVTLERNGEPVDIDEGIAPLVVVVH
jgi:hypothetical protein